MDIKRTITSIFIVPTLKIDKDSLKENGYINGYSKDGHKETQYEDCVYLLFKPEDIDKFRGFLEDEYERTKAIVDDYDYEDGFVVLVYSIDNKFKKDIELVKRSRYSQTSKTFQALFPKTVKIKKGGVSREEISLQYRIFNKTEDLVKFWEDKLDVQFDDTQEVWHAFIEEEETLDINKIKQHV